MKKYDKSGIMKRAWIAYKAGQAWNGAKKSFAECLKIEWAIAKRDVAVEVEMIRYFNEVCVEIIKKGEDETYEAFREFKCNSHKELSSMTTEERFAAQDSYQAHMRAWKAAVAVFRNIAPAFGTELVNSKILSEIQGLEVA